MTTKQEDSMTEKMELEARKESPLAVRDEFDPFMQVDSSELILPVRKLVQGVTRDTDTKRAGEFYDTVAKAYKTELLVAILSIKRSRALFGSNFDEPPLCSSPDANAPIQVEEISLPIGGADVERVVSTGPTCNSCPFSQWGSKGKGQACKLSYNVVCFDLDDKMPFILRIGGSSIKPWREYLTFGRMGEIPAYAMGTIISSEERVFPDGKAFVMQFAQSGFVDGDLLGRLHQQAKTYHTEAVEFAGEDISFE
jgi:hypothetical protein